MVEGCGNTPSCINCNRHHSAAFKQCPKILIHARDNVLRSSSYIPFSITFQQVRGELFSSPALSEQTENQDSKPKPDWCWAVDRATAAANPLTTGTHPAPLQATMAALGVGGLEAGPWVSRRLSKVRRLNMLPYCGLHTIRKPSS